MYFIGTNTKQKMLLAINWGPIKHVKSHQILIHDDTLDKDSNQATTMLNQLSHLVPAIETVWKSYSFP